MEHSPDQHLITAPLVETGSVSGVSQFAVTLHGHVEPGVVPTTYHFAYGATAAYGSVAPLPDVGLTVARGEAPVSQALTGLLPGTEYHYALVASSAAGTFTGPDETFTTAGIPAPAVGTGASVGVGVGEATLTGSVAPHGWDASYDFQYGTSSAYGSVWPSVPVSLGALSGAQPVSIVLRGLQPGTVYHYRLCASGPGGGACGVDEVFTTGEYPAAIVQSPPVFGSFVLPAGETPVVKAKAKAKPKHGKKGSKRSRKRGKKARKAGSPAHGGRRGGGRVG